jgi:hypothetical protein
MDETRLYRKSTEKVCPACGSIYDLYKTFCPLAHCPTCGGLDIKREDTPLSFFVGLGLVLILLELVVGISISNFYGNFVGWPIAGILCISILLGIRTYTRRFKCLNCNSRFFVAKRKIPNAAPIKISLECSIS